MRLFKKAILLTMAFTYSAIAAGSADLRESKAVYDKGWWWYEETVEDPTTKKETKIKYKVSPEEKKKIEREEKTNKLLQMIVIEQKENKKLNSKILERLNYAFPNNTPIYSVNSKGEKCKTNSSSDCFIMPVIAEGQHVPVLKNFMRNPGPTESKEWLKWQAKYFNHVNKISNGLRFAFLKDGGDAYKTSTDYAYGDNLYFGQAENAKGGREAQIIVKMKDKLAYLIFLGQNEVYEKLTKTYQNFHNYDKTFMKQMTRVIVFPSDKSLRKITQYVNHELKSKGYKQAVDFFNSTKKVVRPDLYKTYNIRMTPSTVIFYEDKKNKKKISQTIVAGKVSVSKIRKGTMNFLKYNEIVSAEEMSADKNWNSPEDPVIKDLIKIPTPKSPFDFKKEKQRLDKLESEDKEN